MPPPLEHLVLLLRIKRSAVNSPGRFIFHHTFRVNSLISELRPLVATSFLTPFRRHTICYRDSPIFDMPEATLCLGASALTDLGAYSNDYFLDDREL